MKISEYLDNVNKRYQTGISREHSYRGDLQRLLETLLNNVTVTNEPARVECGAPDYILTNNGIPVGFIEAKDIGDNDLEGKKAHKEQFDRYKATGDPFIFTDYLDFHLYLDGKFITSICIGEIKEGEIVSKPENFKAFQDLITDFVTHTRQTIRSASKLSKMMAGKARLLSNIIANALNSDENAADDRVYEAANTTLREQLDAFRDVLMHDIDAKEFADIYAQTIAYGMFAARLHDPTLDDFTRFEASSLIPKTNPFLRKLFQYIAGYDLDDRIAWVVDSLADIFCATDVAALLEDFGKSTQQIDPIIHFYETFLAEFDPKLRKKRGVWYTPEPVVNFIVRAVDDILKDEFGLKDGLADTSKTTVKVNTDVKDKRTSSGYKQKEKEIHKVQILDPAAGTGTFLAEVVKQVHSRFEGQQGIWPNYVENHLIPRLNGFEILMASYAMAHLKLDMLLRETGYTRETAQRLRVYLTNSLEEHHPDTGTLFAGWLSKEANEANHIKRDTPVMVVLGNPPYSVSSSNKGEWITNLINTYKQNLNERNLNSLSDDYVKFIRYGQFLIEKNGEGVLAYVSNNSFLDGSTHRQMRRSLLKTFDKIYVTNLHGDTRRRDTIPNSIKKDENVFDIQQGVSVSIFIKSTNRNNEDSKIFYKDYFGKRTKKYSSLLDSNISNQEWISLKPSKPYYYFIPKDLSNLDIYNTHISLEDLFDNVGGGIKFRKDSLLVKPHFSPESVRELLDDFSKLDKSGILKKYNFNETKNWKIDNKRQFFIKDDKNNIKPVIYRPFDKRYTYYPIKTINKIIPRGDHRRGDMKQMLKDNLLFVTTKKNRQRSLGYFWISKNIIDLHLLDSAGDSLQSFAVYKYLEDGDQQTLDGQPERKPNLDPEIIQEIAEGLGLTFVPEKPANAKTSPGGPTPTPQKEDEAHCKGGPYLGTFAPIDLLDYIYAVLHSPTYREKYKEFLKIDFPRVPYPESAETFWELVGLGGELRQIHLLEHPVVEEFITTYPESGNNEITRRLTKTKPGFYPYKGDGEQPANTDEVHLAGGLHLGKRYPSEPLGKIQINKEQYFGNVPKKAWEFYIGGYQPAQKWLKDRRDRKLSFEDIQHYQKIIVALMETDRIMAEIDDIEIEQSS